MTSILLDCPECGASAQASVHAIGDDDNALELLEYVCAEGCAGALTVELWGDEFSGSSMAATGEREPVGRVA